MADEAISGLLRLKMSRSIPANTGRLTDGPTSKQRWLNVYCLLGWQYTFSVQDKCPGHLGLKQNHVIIII